MVDEEAIKHTKSITGVIPEAVEKEFHISGNIAVLVEFDVRGKLNYEDDEFTMSIDDAAIVDVDFDGTVADESVIESLCSNITPLLNALADEIGNDLLEYDPNSFGFDESDFCFPSRREKLAEIKSYMEY